jgi:hypothetical protein
MHRLVIHGKVPKTVEKHRELGDQDIQGMSHEDLLRVFESVLVGDANVEPVLRSRGIYISDEMKLLNRELVITHG